MTNEAQDKRPHFVLSDTSEARPFTAHTGRVDKPYVPELLRAQHGASLQTQIQALKPIAEQAVATQQIMGLEGGVGLQIQFQSQPGIALAFESLANDPQHIELLSIREEGEYTYATVFVPDGKLAHFEKHVTKYLDENQDKNGKPRHKALLNTIESIRAAGLRALWMDDPELLPQNPDETFWWEVWLPERGNREAVVEDFQAGLCGWLYRQRRSPRTREPCRFSRANRRYDARFRTPVFPDGHDSELCGRATPRQGNG